MAASRDRNGVAVGIDAGASLAKLAVRGPQGERLELLRSDAPEAIAERVAALGADRIGVTGGGSAALERLLATPVVRVNEFAAWGAGAASLLRRQGTPDGEPYLLVSLGTGTSAMRVDGLAVTRIGGTGIGGGTVLGLAALLLGSDDFGEVAALAAGGDRRRVDLLVSDIYQPGEIPLGGDLTAANFGKCALARPHSLDRGDLAHAIMGLVGESVALVCGGLAAAAGLRRVVFGGSTLRENPSLWEVVEAITSAYGRQVVRLESGEFAGAVGALELATT